MLKPIKMKAALQQKIWGGQKIAQNFSKESSGLDNIGETWEVSDQSGGPSICQSSDLNGKTLSEALVSHSKEILGTASLLQDKFFPLLYKFIDAKDNLSVQVHPGDNSPLGDAKTETWYVVDAPKNGTLILGLTDDTKNKSKDEILDILKSDQSESVLKKVPVEPGDIVFIPAGTVHAITAGMLIYEVQQNSDTTFRIYDYKRLENGKPRQLHLDESAQVIDFEGQEPYKLKAIEVQKPEATWRYLVACKYFSLIELSNLQNEILLPQRESFSVLTQISGEAKLEFLDESLELKQGDSVLIPAEFSQSIPLKLLSRAPQAKSILSFIPEFEKDIQKPLLKAGVSEAEIQNWSKMS